MYDVKNVKYLKDYDLEIIFDNGKKGVINLKDYVKKEGVFNRFSDKEYFKKVYVNNDIGTICWPNGEDIAPETLYAMVTGEQLPEWVTDNVELGSKK